MKNKEAFSRPLLLWVLFFSFLLFAGVVCVYFLGWLAIDTAISHLSASDDITGSIGAVHQQLMRLKIRGLWFGLPFALLLILFWSLLLWGTLRRAVGKRRRELGDFNGERLPTSTERQIASSEKIIYRTDKQKEQRLFAYWLTAFQREGRLIDFFFEELKSYDDAQIGAAVRNIHESCKKVLFRHVKMKAVTDLDEGGEITLEKGFDSREFQLIGNIHGEPPFKGIIRHRGWKITQWDIPDLNGDLKAGIVMPAEIEIP